MARCRNTGSFEKWLAAFKQEALAKGISPRVLAEAAPDLTFDPAIIRRDQGQAVFNLTFLQFSDRLVGGYRMPNGRAAMKKHAATVRRGREGLWRAGAGAHRLLGTGERFRQDLRQLQDPRAR